MASVSICKMCTLQDTPEKCGDCLFKFMNVSTKKPPLGIMPRDIFERKRYNELRECILRYIGAEQPILPEWVEEYNELIKRVNHV